MVRLAFEKCLQWEQERVCLCLYLRGGGGYPRLGNAGERPGHCLAPSGLQLAARPQHNEVPLLPMQVRHALHQALQLVPVLAP